MKLLFLFTIAIAIIEGIMWNNLNSYFFTLYAIPFIIPIIFSYIGFNQCLFSSISCMRSLILSNVMMIFSELLASTIYSNLNGVKLFFIDDFYRENFIATYIVQSFSMFIFFLLLTIIFRNKLFNKMVDPKLINRQEQILSNYNRLKKKY